MRRGIRQLRSVELLEDRRFLAVAGEVVLFDFEESRLHDESWLSAQPAGTAAPYVDAKGDSGNDLLKLAPGEGRNGSQALLVESPDKAAGVPGFWVMKNKSMGGRLDSLMDESGYLVPRGSSVNRLSFWLRFEEGFRQADGADPRNIQNLDVGTYQFDPGKIGGGDRVVESDNYHFYYQLVLRHDLAGSNWIHVVLNTTPTHQRSLSNERDAVNPTQPRGDFWDITTRFYVDLTPYFDDPETGYPARMWVDDISFYYEPDPYQIEVQLGNYMVGEFVDAPVGQMREMPVRVTNHGREPVAGKLVPAARGIMAPVLLDPLTQQAPGPLTIAPGETREFLFRVTPRADTAGQTHTSGVIFIPDAEVRPGNFSQSSPYLRLDQYYGVTGPPDGTSFGASVKIVSKEPRENHVPRVQGGLSLVSGPDRVATMQLDGRDADGDPVTFQLRSQSPRGGRVSLNAETGVATFVPDEGFTGVFRFNYGVSDGKEESADARSWFVVDGNYAPPLDQSGLVPRNDLASVLLANGDLRVAGDVLANDESGRSPLSVVQVDGRKEAVGTQVPAHYGDFYLQPDGRFEYRIRENLPVLQALGLGESLVDAIAYEVSNGVDKRSAILRVKIEGKNHPPHALDDRNLVARGLDANETNGSLLGNDWDSDGNVLTVSRFGAVAIPDDAKALPSEVRGTYGTFHVRADGTYRYVLDNSLPVVMQLAAGEQLEERVPYTVSDGIDTAQALLEVLITVPAAAENRTPVSVFTVLDFNESRLRDEPWLSTQPAGTAVPYIRPVGEATVRLDAGAGRNGSNAVLIEAADASVGMPAAFVLKNIKGARTIGNLGDDRGYLLPRGQRANRLEFWARFDERVRQMYLAGGNASANLRVMTYHYDPATTSTRVIESDNWSFTHDLQVRFDEAGQEWVHVVLAPRPDSQRDNPTTGWNPTASQGEYWELLTRFSVELLPPASLDPGSYPLKMWIDDVALSYVPELPREAVQVRMEAFLPGQVVTIPKLSDRSFRVTVRNPGDKPARGLVRGFGGEGLFALLLDPVTLQTVESPITLAPGEERELTLRLSVLPGLAVNGTATAGCEFVALEELRSANRSQTDARVARPSDGELAPPADAAVTAATIRVLVVAAAGNARPTVQAGRVFEAQAGQPMIGQLVAVDPEGDTLRFSLDIPPGSGAIELDPATGRFSYTPAPGFVGTVRFKYSALDANGASRAGVSWIRIDEKQDAPSSPGDANRDGLFNTTDLVLAFQAGKYEDGVEGGTTWEEGDWNGDGEFNTSDLVAAFQTGQFEAPTAARPQEVPGAAWRDLEWPDRASTTAAAPASDGLTSDWLDSVAHAGEVQGKGSRKSTRSAVSATDAFFSRS